MSAADTLAGLTRSSWANYVSTWVPYENKLIDYATNPGVVNTAMADAGANVNSAFDLQAGATQERLSGLGLSLSGDEQHAATRSLGLSRSLADVNAQNMARDQVIARQKGILGQPAPAVTGAPG